MIDKTVFTNNYREAFGNAAELPLVFWYSDIAAGQTFRYSCLGED